MRSCTDMHTTACCSVLRSMQRVIVLLLQQPVLYRRFSTQSMFCANICFAASALNSCVHVAFRAKSSKPSVSLPMQHCASKFPAPCKTSRACLMCESRSVESHSSSIAAFAIVHSSCPSINIVVIPASAVTVKSSLRFAPLVWPQHPHTVRASRRLRVKTSLSCRSSCLSPHHIN